MASWIEKQYQQLRQIAELNHAVRLINKHPELAQATGVAVGTPALKEAWRVIMANPNLRHSFYAAAITAPAAAWMTVAGTHYFVGETEANALAKWYGQVYTDPEAWHVETDRVVQGAAHALIDDFSEGVENSPAATTAIGQSAWFKFWSSDQAQAKWREIGSGL